MTREIKTTDSSLSPDNNERIVLYSSAPSPCVRRVRITLIEKGLAFDTVEVDLPNMEQRSSDYLQLNPNGTVPALTHGSKVIFDSFSIIEYIEEQFPDMPLMPASVGGKALVRNWMRAEEEMAKVFRPLLYQRLLGPINHISRSLAEAIRIQGRSSENPLDRHWCEQVWRLQILTPEEESKKEHELLTWLEQVESALTHSTYLVGEHFTQADIYLYPRICMFEYLGIEIKADRFPYTLSWMKRLSERKSFEASMTPQAKKLRKLATSPIIKRVRKILKIQAEHRSLGQNIFIYLVGKLIRKIQNVAELAQSSEQLRVLPKPYLNEVPPTFKVIKTVKPDAPSNPVELYGPDNFETRAIKNVLAFLNVPYTFVPAKQLNLLQGKNSIKYFDAAILYLADQFPTESQFSNLTDKRASLRSLLMLDAGSHKELSSLSDAQMREANKQSKDPHFPLLLKRIADKLQLLEKQLITQANLSGLNVGIIDVVWHTRLKMLEALPDFSLPKHSELKTWFERMEAQSQSDSAQIGDKVSA